MPVALVAARVRALRGRGARHGRVLGRPALRVTTWREGAGMRSSIVRRATVEDWPTHRVRARARRRGRPLRSRGGDEERQAGWDRLAVEAAWPARKETGQ